MGLSGISLSSLLVILLIAMFIFGAKRLQSVGKDLGAALKGFREGMSADEDASKPEQSSVDHVDQPSSAMHGFQSISTKEAG